MAPDPALIPPVGAVVTAFFLLAFPVAALVAVWAAVTLFRVVFPERPPAALPRLRGVARPVTVRQIATQQRRPRPVEPAERVATSDFPARTPIEEALWARRN